MDSAKLICTPGAKDAVTVALDKQTGERPIPINFGPTLVVHEDVVLFAGGDRRMTALAVESGDTLWQAKHPPSGHHSPEDLLVAAGLVWAGNIAAGKGSGIFSGRDLHTGEVRIEFPPDTKTYWFHQRCYRSKATDRFLLPSRTGIEFVDMASQHWDTNHWVRALVHSLVSQALSIAQVCRLCAERSRMVRRYLGVAQSVRTRPRVPERQSRSSHY